MKLDYDLTILDTQARAPLRMRVSIERGWCGPVLDAVVDRPPFRS